MANSFKPPKQWCLTENENISSYSNWQSNMLYNLSLCNEFAPFLELEWGKQDITNRGLVDDGDNITDAAARKTAVQKKIILERMLGLIAQFSPSLLRNDIIKRSTSLSWIWQRIRKHFNFSQSEVHFLNLATIKHQPAERYETFYQRLVAHIEDNLLTVASGLLYDGAVATADEVISPTTDRLLVYLWLHLIDQRLPQYVARIYAHDLQTKTLKDIQPQLSQSMEALITELNAQEEMNIHYSRSSFNNKKKFNNFNSRGGPQSTTITTSSKSCILCKTAGRRHQGHDLGSCWYISKHDKVEAAKALQVSLDEDENPVEDISLVTEGVELVDSEKTPEPEILNGNIAAILRKVASAVSPYFYAFFQHFPCKVIVDTGATSSVISVSFLRKIGLAPTNTLHTARGADKKSLDVRGEVQLTLTFGTLQLPISAIVLDTNDCDILAGAPFGEEHDVHVHLKSQSITIQGLTIPYGAQGKSNNIYQVESLIVRNDSGKVVMPGEYVEIHSEDLSSFNGEVAIEPHTDSPLSGDWPPPAITRVIQGTVRIPNNENEPVKIASSQHIARVRRVLTITSPDSECHTLRDLPLSTTPACQPTQKVKPQSANPVNFGASLEAEPSTLYTKSILDNCENLLSKHQRKAFIDLNCQFDSQFTPHYGAYNDHSGQIRAALHLGSTEPPQCKGKLPLYNSSNMQQLQIEADKLESTGVLIRPELLGIIVKHVSPSFLREKPDGTFRFVTAFNNLTQYTRILPTATPTTDDVLRRISKFKYLIKSDFTKSFYQIKVAKSSMPYLATVTPFKGIRVYARCPNGMPGCSEYLEELTSRVFGDYAQEGWLALIADDLFIGGNTVDEMLERWKLVLQRLKDNNLTLNPEKTMICPKKCTILGWSWSCGTITPTSHKISALASVAKPKTCTAMKSFIGAFRAISRCIPRYASLLSPLEDSIKGIKGAQLVTWTPELETVFIEAQTALKSPRALTIPLPSDRLVLTVDASPLNKGIGATLFILRDNKRLLSGFFSFKLKQHQIGWLPCELEALAITAGVRNFATYARESKYPLQVLTDSKPCVLAYRRLCQGQFSASARVSTFLSCLSSHNVIVCHIAGIANPSSDFSSRHPQQCDDNSCEICKFVQQTADSVVNAVAVSDIIAGNAQLPFLNRNAWKAAQQNCPDMRRAFAHLTQGTRPSRKARHLKHVKKYLSVATVDENGLIIVRKQDSFFHQRSLIVVPFNIMPGIITAMHLYLKHPTRHQLTQVFNRYFYGITSSSFIEDVVNHCTQCNSMKTIPKEIYPQSISSIPKVPGDSFFADVIAHEKQNILVTRDVLSSYTNASLIVNETADTLRTALVTNTSFLRKNPCTIRVDTAPGFQALYNDITLNSLGITIDLGRTKNKDSNSVVDKGIQELEEEILKHDMSGSPLTPLTLQNIVDTLNARIRNRGLSAKEIVLKRDQYSHEAIDVNDELLANQQLLIRNKNHPSSSRSKATHKVAASKAAVVEGDLVHIKHEKQKHRLRDRYIVTKIVNDLAFLQKLNEKFMSRQYEVPLTALYPASPSTPYLDWDSHPREMSSEESSVEEPLTADSESDHAEESEEEPASATDISPARPSSSPMDAFR